MPDIFWKINGDRNNAKKKVAVSRDSSTSVYTFSRNLADTQSPPSPTNPKRKPSCIQKVIKNTPRTHQKPLTKCSLYYVYGMLVIFSLPNTPRGATNSLLNRSRNHASASSLNGHSWSWESRNNLHRDQRLTLDPSRAQCKNRTPSFY